MPASPKILLVDDDRSIASALSVALQNIYDLTVALNGCQALSKTDTTEYEVIVLDLNLPDIPGLEVCQRLRERGVITPILILSAESKVLTKISLLDAGANDYLTKPFSLGEFKARLRTLSRLQAKPNWPTAKLEAYGIELDRNKFSVKRDGLPVRLRPKEFAILEFLMENAGAVVKRSDLMHAVWQDADEPWKNTLDVHIKYLRDKLDKPFEQKLIQTVHSLGYQLTPINLAEPVKT